MKLLIQDKTSTSDTSQDIFDKILRMKNITNKEGFLKPMHPSNMAIKEAVEKDDWKEFSKNLSKVVQSLKKCREKGEVIVVYTDYDADGITGGAIMWEVLYEMGFSVMPYVPDRREEGYGFSKKGIDTVLEKYKAKFVISVDHGVVANHEISYAKKKGISVIVTDHHKKKERLPKDAFAVLHTTIPSGAGVAYFVAHHLARKLGGSKNTLKKFKDDYCALAAIGTIADLVPLRGVNRNLVYHGLKALVLTSRPGLKKIMKEGGVDKRVITTYDVGHVIAPRINAFGRLIHGIDALRLLCTTREDKASLLADLATKTNKKRQELVLKAVEEAVLLVGSRIPPLIIVVSDFWNEGIIGLVASRLAEKYHAPTIAMTCSNGQLKGSVRSIPGIDIINFLRLHGDLFIDLGGHEQAAGFTLSSKNAELMKKTLLKNIPPSWKEVEKGKTIQVDLSIFLSQATMSLAKKLQCFEPYGIGNPQPLFVTKALVQSASVIGKNGAHLELILREGEYLFKTIYFNGGENIITLNRGEEVSCVFALQVDTWGGREVVKGFIKHLSIST